MSVRANTTIQVLRPLGRLGFVRRRRERRTVDDLVRRLRIRMASIEQPVQSLSGGNQQKVSLTRPFLRGDVKVILAEEPTQGVDVGARFDIYEALRAKANEGVAVIVKSSDPLELAGLCDRVIVMSRGQAVIAAMQLSGVRRLLQMSSLNAGRGSSHYLKSRGEAEAAVHACEHLGSLEEALELVLSVTAADRAVDQLVELLVGPGAGGAPPGGVPDLDAVDGPLDGGVEPLERDVMDIDDRHAVEVLEARRLEVRIVRAG